MTVSYNLRPSERIISKMGVSTLCHLWY